MFLTKGKEEGEEARRTERLLLKNQLQTFSEFLSGFERFVGKIVRRGIFVDLVSEVNDIARIPKSLSFQLAHGTKARYQNFTDPPVQCLLDSREGRDFKIPRHFNSVIDVWFRPNILSFLTYTTRPTSRITPKLIFG